jgi:hypothetical protein
VNEPHTLAEAEVIARHAGKLNWWADKIMEEYDRREAALPEWHCPSCGAVTRARMADAEPVLDHWYAGQEIKVEFADEDDEYDRSQVKPDPQKVRPIGADHIIAERDALQARVDVLSPMVEDLTEISREAQSRVELLTAALTDVLANTYRWDTIAGAAALFNARAVLAAGETESEADA